MIASGVDEMQEPEAVSDCDDTIRSGVSCMHSGEVPDRPPSHAAVLTGGPHMPTAKSTQRKGATAALLAAVWNVVAGGG